MMKKSGFTLIEMILVMLIVAIGGALAIPKVQQSVENRQAKQALQTVKHIHHAVRSFEVDKGELPDPSADIPGMIPTQNRLGDIGEATTHATRLAQNYVNSKEFYDRNNIEYLLFVIGGGGPATCLPDPSWCVQATLPSDRTITMQEKGTIDDSDGFLDFTP